MADGSSLFRLCGRFLRTPTLYDTADDATFVFTPTLTPAEQAIFDDLKLMAKFSVEMTLAEWQAIKPDVALLQAFAQGTVASKTLADVVNATRAHSRILRTIVRS
jgi:hypothetical protein